MSAPWPDVITFLLTDIEGSTRLWEEHPDAMASALEAHDGCLRAAVEGHGGRVVKTTGDGLLAAFRGANEGLEAALDGQRALAEVRWGRTGQLSSRMALHAGTAQVRGDDFFGPALNRVARLLAIGHGGQILLSGPAEDLVRGGLSDGVTLADRGRHRLKDLEQPEHVFEVHAPGLRSDFPPLRSLAPVRTNLPIQVTSFVGRERELADLRRLTGERRLVTLVGTGGTGKTRLMIQAAAELVDEFADGAWLVELAPIADASLVSPELARVLGVQEFPGHPLLDGILDFLRAKQVLLLLDNCEHLIGEVAELAERLLQVSPGLRMLASSREALGIDGETAYRVPSLGVPPLLDRSEGHVRLGPDELAQIAEAEAVRLFTDRAAAGLPGFQLTEATAPAVVEICRRLDGIPLALELAAARVTVLSVEEIAQRLGDRFRLLTGGRRTALPRQQTLQALVDWSWDLLEERERRVLQRLSVFAGGWTLEAAAAVASDPGRTGDPTLDTLDALGRLVDKSLVVVDRGTATRYRMLETIRQYARERLMAAGDAAAVRDRHLAYFLALSLEAEPHLRGRDMLPWLRRMDPEADNIRAALEWALETDPDSALLLAPALGSYWAPRSAGSEVLGWLVQVIEVARTLPVVEGEALRRRQVALARVLAAAAGLSATLGLPAGAREWGAEAVELATAAGDLDVLVEAYGAGYLATLFGGGAPPPREAVTEFARLAEAREDWMSLGYAVASLAYAAILDGREADARALIDEATSAADRSGNPMVIAFIAITRGRLAGLLGDVDEARHWLEVARRCYAELGEERFLLMARSDLAHALRRGGQVAEAEAIYRETIHAWVHAGNRGAIAHELESFGYLALAGGLAERAVRLLGAAAVLRELAAAPMLPDERVEFEAALARGRDQLGAGPFAAAWDAGRGLDQGEAVAFALAR